MKPKTKREVSTIKYESKETSDGTVFQIVHFTSPPKKVKFSLFKVPEREAGQLAVYYTSFQSFKITFFYSLA